MANTNNRVYFFEYAESREGRRIELRNIPKDNIIDFGADEEEVKADTYTDSEGNVIIKTYNGKTYILGLGGFDGTNPDEAAPADEAEWYGTQEEYDAIAEKNPNVTYYIYEEE